jgi:hypothetical protein
VPIDLSDTTITIPNGLTLPQLTLSGTSVVSSSASFTIGQFYWLGGTLAVGGATITNLNISGTASKIASTVLTNAVFTVTGSFVASGTGGLQLVSGVELVLACNGTFQSFLGIDGLGSFVVETNQASTGLLVASGTTNWYGSVSLESGKIEVASGATLKSSGEFNWISGVVSGPGSFWNTASGVTTISASSSVSFVNANVYNYGTLDWAVPSTFSSIPTPLGTLANVEGGTITISASTNVLIPVAIANSGSLLLPTTTVTFPNISNSGSISSDGAITVNQLGTCDGSINAYAFSYLASSAATFACNLQSNVLQVVSGQLTFTNSYSVVTQLYQMKELE